MATLKRLVTQSGADTTTSVSVSTGITVDGKTGWQVTGLRAVWKDCAAVAAADYLVEAFVASTSTAPAIEDEEYIQGVAWALQNTAGTAVVAAVEPVKANVLSGRTTVQPTLYLFVRSTGTSQANDIVIELEYETVKLTDLEVLRLLQAGA